jgi:hypothetical protein
VRLPKLFKRCIDIAFRDETPTFGYKLSDVALCLFSRVCTLAEKWVHRKQDEYHKAAKAFHLSIPFKNSRYRRGSLGERRLTSAIYKWSIHK